PGQAGTATPARGRLVPLDVVGVLDLPQGAALMPRLATGPTTGLAAQRLRCRLAQPLRRRRLVRVARVLTQPATQLRVLLREPPVLLSQTPILRLHQQKPLQQLLNGRSFGHARIMSEQGTTAMSARRHLSENLSSYLP